MVNPRTEAYLGMAKEQMLGRLYTDVLPKMRGHEVLLRQQQTMAEGRPDHFEFLSPTIPASGLSSTSFPMKMA
jgi:hypothetical protein